MTCAKRVVSCIIRHEHGFFLGDNSCRNPQSSCPRLPGEDYEKCKTICEQEGHAEMVALKYAGDLAKGATAIISGIDHSCKNCSRALFVAGIKEIIIRREA